MFKDKLRVARENIGLSQTEVATKLSTSRQAYNHYETGRREPPLEVLSILAEILHVSLDFLLEKDEKEKKPTTYNCEKNKIFGSTLKELRESKKLSQQELANFFSISQSTVGNWESGTRVPNVVILQKLAIFFDVSVDCLLGNDGKKKPDTNEGNEHINTVVIYNADGKVIQKRNTDNLLDRIKQLRKEHSLSQAGLGKMLGVGQSTVAMWENGKNKPEHAYLEKLSEYFHVSVDYLLGKTNQKEPAADEGDGHINTVVIRNRDGKVIQKQYTDKKLERIIKMIDLLAEEDSDL